MVRRTCLSPPNQTQICRGWPSHSTPTMAFGGTVGVRKDLLGLEQGCPQLWALIGQGEVISHSIRSEISAFGTLEVG